LIDALTDGRFCQVKLFGCKRKAAALYHRHKYRQGGYRIHINFLTLLIQRIQLISNYSDYLPEENNLDYVPIRLSTTLNFGMKK
jgi:hypothetical protein